MNFRIISQEAGMERNTYIKTVSLSQPTEDMKKRKDRSFYY